MNPGFQINCRNSADNLHITLSGDFNGMCAWNLLKILKGSDVTGRIFVNTKGIRNMPAEGVNLFSRHMSGRKLPPDWLYFKGEKGFTLAPDGSRVLICNRDKKTLKKKRRFISSECRHR